MIDAATSANRFEAASNTKQQLEKWSLIEDIIYNQKSIVQWLKLGDANTTYFYASMKGRKTQNQIRTLSTKGGTILKSEDSIEAEIVRYYKRLLGSSTQALPAINPGVMQEGSVLSRSLQLQLIAPFTREDVAQALKGVDDSKALGGDGFNSCFFKKSGHVLGDEVTDAVLQFFDTGAIYFQQFSSASGLIANQSKSCIYFGGVPEGVQQDIMRLLDLAGELYHSDILGYQ
uniref:Uncharacterized protein n=1 Tax=Nicotiana tabacum TaxID=4097 RepID=A0A1S4B3T4_TOBAC|nr:PREDICTED: uncharacterized protein LOC107804176 [Nicotiana tabacum]